MSFWTGILIGSVVGTTSTMVTLFVLVVVAGPALVAYLQRKGLLELSTVRRKA